MEYNTKSLLIKAYCNLVESGIFFPNRNDLLEAGFSRDQLRHNFGNLSNLRKASQELEPDLFKGVVLEEQFIGKKHIQVLKNKIKKYKRFIVTSAVNGQKANLNFLKSLENYCKVNDALILIVPSYNKIGSTSEWHFDSELMKYDFVFSEINLNDNVQISDIRITARQISPITGLGRLVQKDKSAIFGSPKQSLEYIPISNVKYPHALMSTGAITLANYTDLLNGKMRQSFLAKNDHVNGAIVVEIEDDALYHFRQIQCDDNGNFVDLGVLYTKNKTKKVKSTLVIGDYHAGEHDVSAESAWIEVAKKINPIQIVMHDIQDGLSTNPHEKGNFVLLAKRSKKAQLDVKGEFRKVGEVLNTWTDLVRKIIVVRSNHDEFLHRWLATGTFSNDPYNFQIGCELANKMVDGIDPLIEGLKKYGNLKNKNKIKFLERDEDFKIAGIELGNHGDLGANGSRGSKANLEKTYGKAVIGHSHTPGILRGVYQVGTTSKLKLEYNRGPSSWLHCSCIVYENGQRQLINSIEGKWHLQIHEKKIQK